MATNLLEDLHAALTPDVVTAHADATGATPSMAADLLSVAVPVLAASLAQGATPAGFTAFVASVPSGAASSDTAQPALAQPLLAQLFPGQTDALARLIAGSVRSTIGAGEATLALLLPLFAERIGHRLGATSEPVTEDNVRALLRDTHPLAMAALTPPTRSMMSALPAAAALMRAKKVKAKRQGSLILALFRSMPRGRRSAN